MTLVLARIARSCEFKASVVVSSVAASYSSSFDAAVEISAYRISMMIKSASLIDAFWNLLAASSGD